MYSVLFTNAMTEELFSIVKRVADADPKFLIDVGKRAMECPWLTDATTKKKIGKLVELIEFAHSLDDELIAPDE